MIACVIAAGSARASAQAPPAAPTPADPAPAAEPVPAGEPVPLPPAKLSTVELRRARAQAEETCAAKRPECDWVATLSTLERASVLRALTARGYTVEPSPWGKVVGKIHVFNEEVFAEGAGFVRFFNVFHYTTRESTIRGEAVIAPGELWDQARIDETARRLRDPLFTSVVAVIPVQTAASPEAIDVLIVTRDIWSLRLNTSYTFQQGKLTNLSTSLAENNLLGRRQVLAAGLTMDQGSIAVGPIFIDKNFLGKQLDLRARVDSIANRDDLLDDGRYNSEGSQSSITLSRPLWSLASKWGAGVSFTHRYAINRQFLGTRLRTFDYVDPETMETTSFDREYAMRSWTANAYVTRQWGDAVKHQLAVGHTVNLRRPRPLDEFSGDAAQRAAFITGVLPRSEVSSEPFVQYSLFTPRYRTLRNIATFDLAEDARLGPDLDLVAAFGLRALGSDDNFQRLSATLGWTFPWAREGFLRVAAGTQSRYQDSEWIDSSAAWSMSAAAPAVAGIRLLAQTGLSTRWNDTQNGFYAIGSDNGLRGYTINEFIGQRRFTLQVEARTLPYPIWVLRLGAVVFYDLGGASDTLADMKLHQDAGIGLRILIPQTSVQLLKADFAFPFDGSNRGKVRFISGFGSEF